MPLNKRVSGTPRPKPTSTRSLKGRSVPQILCKIYSKRSRRTRKIAVSTPLKSETTKDHPKAAHSRWQASLGHVGMLLFAQSPPIKKKQRELATLQELHLHKSWSVYSTFQNNFESCLASQEVMKLYLQFPGDHGLKTTEKHGLAISQRVCLGGFCNFGMLHVHKLPNPRPPGYCHRPR